MPRISTDRASPATPGTSTMDVELTGVQASLFAAKLGFDMKWSLDGDTPVSTTHVTSDRYWELVQPHGRRTGAKWERSCSPGSLRLPAGRSWRPSRIG